ncbi:hypothetical protein N7461_000771 [Penicillium sp. DV-2018c]|nr:hypothetical protein N7461_000771 [Penicillium sp. DV-2018c]
MQDGKPLHAKDEDVGIPSTHKQAQKRPSQGICFAAALTGGVRVKPRPKNGKTPVVLEHKPRKKARQEDVNRVAEEFKSATLEPAIPTRSRTGSVSSTPSVASVTPGSKIHQTKRSKQASRGGSSDGIPQRFTDGKWIVLKAVLALPSPDMSGPKHVETRKKLRVVKLHSIDIARQLAGTDVTIKDGAGKPQKVKVQPYYTRGSTHFVTDRADAISSKEIVWMRVEDVDILAQDTGYVPLRRKQLERLAPS